MQNYSGYVISRKRQGCINVQVILEDFKEKKKREKVRRQEKGTERRRKDGRKDTYEVTQYV